MSLCVAFSPDGKAVAVDQDNVVRLWEAGGRQPPEALQGHSGAVDGPALSGDGRLVANGSVHGHTGGIRGVVLSGDGRLVASGGDDGTVRLREPGNGACLRTLRTDRR